MQGHGELFQLKYTGPSVDSGSIPVATLAPSLLAIDRLAKMAVGATAEGDPKIEVIVTAEARRGSFELVLAVRELWDGVVNFTKTGDFAAAKAILEILGLSGLGLFQLLKRSRKRKIARREPAPPRNGLKRVRVHFTNRESLSVPERTADLFEDQEARHAVRELVAPLEIDGVHSMEFQVYDKRTRIPKAALPSFAVPEVRREAESDDTMAMRVTLVSPVFKDGNKWRVDDGRGPFFAAIRDKSFLRSVKEGAPFRQGDVLEVKMLIRQWREGTFLRKEHAILRITKHEKRKQQKGLFDNSGD
jgi:hypothetical protein